MPSVKQAILYGARDLRLEERSVDGGEFVRTEVTALSTGTDLANYEGRSTELPGAPDYPRWVGYSNVGVVERTGRRIFTLKPHASGFVLSEGDLAVDVPAGVTPECASLAYLTHLGYAALERAGFRSGERVHVIGLGVIGLCTVALAKSMGARVSASANSSARQALAEGLGAERDESAAELVVLTANTWSAYRSAIDRAGRFGRISVLGFPGRAQPAPDFNPLDPAWLYGKQLAIFGAGASPNTLQNLEHIFRLMAGGVLSLEPVISHRLPWWKMKEAYELAQARDKSLTAAIFDWRMNEPR